MPTCVVCVNCYLKTWILFCTNTLHTIQQSIIYDILLFDHYSTVHALKTTPYHRLSYF